MQNNAHFLAADFMKSPGNDLQSSVRNMDDSWNLKNDFIITVNYNELFAFNASPEL